MKPDTPPAPEAQRGCEVFIVTGEPSGDFLGAQLARALRGLDAAIGLRGVGSRRMREAGVELFLDSTNWSVVGVGEALRKYLMLRRRFRAILRELRASPPDVLVLIDYGYFNSRVARFARRMGLRIVYYFQPRSWSRNPGRAARIADIVDVVAAPFPWSVKALSGRRAAVQWVGHPLVDVVPALPPPGPPGDSPLIALVPGSRQQEIRHILPAIAGAARLVARTLPQARFVLAVAPGLARCSIAECLRREGVQAVMVEGVDYNAVSQAHAAVVTSGTATLELALLGVPMVVAYRVGIVTWLQYQITQALFGRIRYIAMPNILADAPIVPEVRQTQANPRAIARLVLRLVTDPERSERMRQDMARAARLLGPPGAVESAARVVLSLLQAQPRRKVHVSC